MPSKGSIFTTATSVFWSLPTTVPCMVRPSASCTSTVRGAVGHVGGGHDVTGAVEDEARAEAGLGRQLHDRRHEGLGGRGRRLEVVVELGRLGGLRAGGAGTRRGTVRRGGGPLRRHARVLHVRRSGRGRSRRRVVLERPPDGEAAAEQPESHQDGHDALAWRGACRGCRRSRSRDREQRCRRHRPRAGAGAEGGAWGEARAARRGEGQPAAAW